MASTLALFEQCVVILCLAFGGAIRCEMDDTGTADSRCILESPPTAANFSCLQISYYMSSDDVQLEVTLSAADVVESNYSLSANMHLIYIPNPNSTSPIVLRFQASSTFVSSSNYEDVVISNVMFSSCPSAIGL